MEAWPIMTKWENHPWSEKTYGCLWKAVGDFLVQQALKDWILAKRIAGWKIPCQKDLIWTLAKRMGLSRTRGLYSWAIAKITFLRLGQYQNIFWMYQLFLTLNKTAVWNQWKTLSICIEIKISKYIYIYLYIYIFIFIYLCIVSCALFWFHGIAQCHHKGPLPKGVKQQTCRGHMDLQDPLPKGVSVQ